MRTTLKIDDDVLGAAKELAAREKTTAGKILSALARKGIHTHRAELTKKIRNGFEVLPAKDRVITPQLVQKILEESAEA